MSNKFSNKIQSISNKFQNYSNQITSPLLKNFNPSYVKMSPIKSQNLYTFKEQTFFLANLHELFKFQIIKIYGEPQKFQGSKFKRSDAKVKILTQNVKASFFAFFFSLECIKVSLVLNPKFYFFLTSIFFFTSDIHSLNLCVCVWGQSVLWGAM